MTDLGSIDMANPEKLVIVLSQPLSVPGCVCVCVCVYKMSVL